MCLVSRIIITVFSTSAQSYEQIDIETKKLDMVLTKQNRYSHKFLYCPRRCRIRPLRTQIRQYILYNYLNKIDCFLLANHFHCSSFQYFDCEIAEYGRNLAVLLIFALFSASVR